MELFEMEVIHLLNRVEATSTQNAGKTCYFIIMSSSDTLSMQ